MLVSNMFKCIDAEFSQVGENMPKTLKNYFCPAIRVMKCWIMPRK